MTQGQFFKRSLNSEYSFKRSLNSEYSFSLTSCFTKAEEPSLPYYLPIAEGGNFRFIPFPSVLELCEMQSVSSRIWTCVVVSISYDDNYYTTGTSLTISIIRYGSRVKWSNPGKSVALSLTPRWSSYWKGSLQVIVDYDRPTLLSLLYTDILPNNSTTNIIEKLE